MHNLFKIFSIPKEDDNEPTSSSPDQEDRESVADIRNPEDYREIFQPKQRLGEKNTPPTM